MSKQASPNGFGSTLKKLAVLKVLSGILIMVLYNLIYAKGKKREMDACVDRTEEIHGVKKRVTEVVSQVNRKMKKSEIPNSSKKKTTLVESMAELSKSKELKSMAKMVLGYNVCVELTEVLWKAILRETFPNESAYMSYMAKFSQAVGFIALLLQLTASTIIRILGWTNASKLTPLTMSGLAFPFFVAVAISKRNQTIVSLKTALTIGTCQNVINKIAKYSLFDPLKEMAYIPMSPDAKIKGKAAIDVLGARLGRSLAAGAQQILVLKVGSILECSPYLAVFYFSTIALWMSAVNTLGKLFEKEKPQMKNTRRL